MRFLSTLWIVCFLVSSVSYGTDRKEDEENTVSALSSRRSSLTTCDDPSAREEGIDDVTGLYYSGAKFQQYFLPDTYVKDDILDDRLKVSLAGAIDASYTKGIQIISENSNQFSLNQQRRLLSPLFYLVRTELRSPNSDNLYHRLSHHMKRVWTRDGVRSDIDLDGVVGCMRPFATQFLDIGRGQVRKIREEAQKIIESTSQYTEETSLLRPLLTVDHPPLYVEVGHSVQSQSINVPQTEDDGGRCCCSVM